MRPLLLLLALLLVPGLAAAEGPLSAVRSPRSQPEVPQVRAAPRPPDPAARAPDQTSCTIWANGPSELFRIDLRALRVLGKVPLQLPPGEQLTDITYRGSTLLGVSFGTLYELDERTGVARALGPLSGSFNGLAGGTGRLYAGANAGTLYEFDLREGRAVPLVGFGQGLSSSGDLLVLRDGSVLVTATFSSSGGGLTDTLLRIDPDRRTVRVLGAAVRGEIYGLTECDGEVFGLTAGGEVLSIDPGSGSSKVLGRLPVQIWGAAQKPERLQAS